jgi:hypothetical protein
VTVEQQYWKRLSRKQMAFAYAGGDWNQITLQIEEMLKLEAEDVVLSPA